MKLLSVVIPAYNEQNMIPLTAKTLSKLLTDNNICYELIFIDDGSKDDTWKIISEICQNSPHVYGIHFSRNFGKESAIIAGLTEAKGDCCVVIDCDLQHPPEKIIEMYRLWENGYEIVEGYKTSRGKEGVFHSLAAKIFYYVISAATGVDMANSSDFKLLDRKAVNAIINMNEKNSFFRAMSSWIGFKTAKVEFDVRKRPEGESKWSTLSLIKYALKNVSSFSSAPMQLVTVLGIITFLVSVVIGAISLSQYFCGQSLEGFTTVILIQLFSSSIFMISLGIIGYYIAKIYEEIKGRPKYIISKKAGEEREDTEFSN